MNQNRKHAPVSWKRGLVSLLVAMLVLNLCMPGIVTRAEELPAQEATAQIPEEGTVLPEGGAADENLQPLTEEDSQEEITKEDTKEDTTEEESSEDITKEDTTTEEDTSEDITEEEITTGEDPAVEDTEVVSEIRSVNTIVTDAAVSGQQVEEASFYDQLMAAESCQEIFNLMMSDTDACLLMSEEEVAQLKEKVSAMEDDGYQTDVLATITYLEEQLGGCTCGAAEGEEHDTSCPVYEITTYAETLNQSYWKNTIQVYYDTVDSISYGGSTSKEGVGVTNVNLAGTAVTYGNAGTTSWSGGTTLATYYPGATTSKETTASLKITASEGYYVTGVVVACAPKPGTQLTPFKCSTWSGGLAYAETFNLSQSTYSNGLYTLTKDLSSKAFCHDSNSKGTGNYFILILVAPVPTPLYVEYNYGNVTDFLTVDSDSAFYNPTWTVKNSDNNYGTGGVYTNDTQFAYGYENNDTSVIANWKHTANTVSDDALTEAANAGYYFTGWEVTWYNDCEPNDADNAYRDNYTFNFDTDDVYMTGSYQPGDAVQLPTHVRLVAQWAPIPMTVTKDVNGLPEGAGSHTYEIAVKKDGEAFGTVTLSVTDNGETTVTVKDSSGNIIPVTPGTYTVDETQPAELVINNVRYYVNVDESATVTVSANANANGTGYNLKVTNTYGDTANDIPDTTFVQVQKTFTGITAVPENFYITIGEIKYYATDAVKTTGDNEEIILTWTIEGAAAGSYSITESNYQVEDFTHTATGFGSGITVTQATMSAIQTGDVTTCANLTINLDAEIEFVVVKSGNDFIIWTEEYLSANQRTAIVNAIKTAGIQSSIKEANCVFFSADAISPENGGLTYGGSTMTYDPAKKTLAFNETCAWSNLAYGTYSVDVDSAEIVLGNNYVPNNTSLTVSKTVSGNMLSYSQPFTFHMAIVKDGANYVIPTANLPAGVTYENGVYVFSLKHNESITFEELIPIGANITITEQEIEGLTFETYINGSKTADADRAHEITNIQVKESVAFKNEHDVVVDTGLRFDSFPMYLLMSTMIVFGGLLLISKRRYGDWM